MLTQLTNFDWAFDVTFHVGLLGLNYWAFGKEKLIRNYLISLLVGSWALSYLLKKENV